MSPIMVGGNDSVTWTVHADKVRSTKTSSVSTVHDQEGIDETDAKGFFTVTIKLPSNREAREDFIAQVKKFCAEPRGSLIVRFPIEDKAYLGATTDKVQPGVHDQIKIDWPK
jgi:hypothetical protein